MNDDRARARAMGWDGDDLELICEAASRLRNALGVPLATEARVVLAVLLHLETLCWPDGFVVNDLAAATDRTVLGRRGAAAIAALLDHGPEAPNQDWFYWEAMGPQLATARHEAIYQDLWTRLANAGVRRVG